MTEETSKIDASGKEPDTSTKERRRSTKWSREYEIIASDRNDMLDAANTLIENIVAKQVMPCLGSMPVVDNCLSQDEESAYNAALGYLKRQFEVGHRDSEVMEVKRSAEDEFGGK